MAGRTVRHRLIAVGLAALLGTGCSATGPSSGAESATPQAVVSGSESGSESGNRSGSEASDDAALAAVTAWLSFDTRVDRRPNDTARRLALARLAPALRAQVTGFSGAAAPGVEWVDWTRRHARATVTAALGHDDRPPDTATTAYRQVVATLTLHGDGGWTLVRRQTVYLELARTGNRWLVTDLRVQPYEPQASAA